MSTEKLNQSVVICSFNKTTVELFKNEEAFPEQVIKALEEVRETRLSKDKGKDKGEEQLFMTQADFRAFLKGRLAAFYNAYISEIEKRIELQSALVHSIPEASDFTLIFDRTAGPDDPVENLLKQKCREKPSPETSAGKPKTSYECELWLWDNDRGVAASGRVLACSCFRGRKWSLTFRLQKEYPKRKKKDKFYNVFEEITETLYDTIFKAQDFDTHGLIVISGRTGSGKSQIAQRLIESYLKKLSDSGEGIRTPHLLTHEDPVEKEFAKQEIGNADYTQRQNRTDTRSLRETLKNALRQTPRVVFRGETRKPREWDDLLGFAGTGHLVITTSHAGSLVEAMGNILQATRSRTPAARSVVADRLLAVVHIKSGAMLVDSETEKNVPVSFLIPAMWHRTPSGIKALMSEGLSSLLPNTPAALNGRKPENLHLPGSVSRYWFARELIRKAQEARGNQPDAETRILERAIEWDLEGI